MQDNILNTALDKISKPTKTARLRLLITFNIVFGGGLLFFLLVRLLVPGMQKSFINPLILYGTTVPPIVINFVSLIYNVLVLWEKLPNNQLLYKISGYASLGSYMIMSLLNIFAFSGRGLDLMVTNFAMCISVVFYSVAAFSMRVALAWSLLVMTLYLAQLNYKGYDYEYHFMTNAESIIFRKKLENQEPEALERAKILRKEGKYPVSFAQYIYIFTQYMVLACFCAYSFAGVLDRIAEILPSVISDIKEAGQTLNKANKDVELANTSLAEHKRKLIASELLNTEKRELISNLKESFSNLKLDYQSHQKIERIIDAYIKLDNDLSDFRTHFESIDPVFFQKLEQISPRLSANEMKHCAYLRMKLNNKDIAQVMRITVDSLRNSRHRLAKKLGIEGDKLRDFIENI